MPSLSASNRAMSVCDPSRVSVAQALKQASANLDGVRNEHQAALALSQTGHGLSDHRAGQAGRVGGLHRVAGCVGSREQVAEFNRIFGEFVEVLTQSPSIP